jgi:lysozyme
LNFLNAIELICKYEGFNEKAYPDPYTGDTPFTIGYGTQYYPDGEPVNGEHCCTKEKALEYVKSEIELIDEDLEKLNLHIDISMKEALISFIHSIGWSPFLFTNLPENIENENWPEVAVEFSRWIFDCENNVIGSLVDRRREEIKLFFKEINDSAWGSTEILLHAFRNYIAAPNQVRAIRKLEENISPQILADFGNEFDINKGFWLD